LLGYRKIPGDTCENPLPHYISTLKDCPESAAVTLMTTIAIALGAVVVVFVALVVGFCFGVRDERVRKMFPWLNLAPSWVTAGYSNSLIVAEMGDEFGDDAVRSEDDVQLSTSKSESD